MTGVFFARFSDCAKTGDKKLITVLQAVKMFFPIR
jgi:hypothetical protein